MNKGGLIAVARLIGIRDGGPQRRALSSSDHCVPPSGE